MRRIALLPWCLLLLSSPAPAGLNGICGVTATMFNQPSPRPQVLACTSVSLPALDDLGLAALGVGVGAIGCVVIAFRKKKKKRD